MSDDWVDDWRGYVFIVVVFQGVAMLVVGACSVLSHL